MAASSTFIDPSTGAEFTTDGGDAHLHDIISKLQFISMVQPDHKIFTENLSQRPLGLWTSIYRSLFNTAADSREDAYQFVHGVVMHGVRLATHFLSRAKTSTSPKEVQYCTLIGNMLIRAVVDSKTGIHNLKVTYQSDTMFTSKFDTLERIIDARLVVITSEFGVEIPAPGDEESP